MVLGFHFGAVEHGESQRREQVFELALDARDGVQMAAARRGRRQREIQPFGVQARAESRFGELPLPGLEGVFERLFDAVEEHAGALAFFGRQFAHVLAGQGERAFAAEGLDADGLQFLGAPGGGDAGQGTGFQFL